MAMDLQRVGVLLFGVGLCVSLFSAIAFGTVAGGTELLCQDHDPSYTLEDVDVTGLSVQYSNGCNSYWSSPLVAGGGVVTGIGLLVGLCGVGQYVSSDE
jgi:hypothetical protein